MMFFFPVGQESAIRRWPIVTITLISVMFVVQLYNELTIKQQKRKFRIAEIRFNRQIDHIKRIYITKYSPEINENDYEETVKILDEFSRNTDKNMLEALEKGDLVPLDSDEYADYKEARKKYKQAQHQFLWGFLGFVPNDPKPWTWITSIFIHGNLFHFLGNIVFFWFIGCNIEDRWGRWVYSILFFTGGIAAIYVHQMSMPFSSEPAIGASGAIAALMGAFLVRFPKIPTRVFWLWFGFTFRYGVIVVPAYIGLFVWFIFQIGLMVLNIGNIAYWAHIGGFLFGMIFAVILMVFGIDRVLNRQVENIADRQQYTTEFEIDPILKKALDEESKGRFSQATQLLSRRLQNHPDDLDVRERLGRLLLKQNRIRTGTMHLSKLIPPDLSADGLDSALATINIIDQSGGFHYIPAQILLDTAELLLHFNRIDQGKDILYKLQNRTLTPEIAIKVSKISQRYSF